MGNPTTEAIEGVDFVLCENCSRELNEDEILNSQCAVCDWEPLCESCLCSHECVPLNEDDDHG